MAELFHQFFLQITSFSPYFIRSLADCKEGQMKGLFMHWTDGADLSI